MIGETSKPVYLITEEDIQRTALFLIMRRLTDEEMRRVAIGISYGLSEIIDTTIRAAIEEALSR